MKAFRMTAATAALLTGMLVATASHAAVINYDGSLVDLGTVSAGQTGTITNSFSGTASGPYLFGTGMDYGFLPTDTAITFSYTYANMNIGQLSSYGSYHYASNGSTLSGSSYDISGGAPVSVGYSNSAVSAPLVLAAANLNGSLTSGTTTIVNTATGMAQFQTAFAGLFNSNGRVVSLSYAVSAVPLPAALPMFATVLAGLFGFAMLRKRTAI